MFIKVIICLFLGSELFSAANNTESRIQKSKNSNKNKNNSYHWNHWLKKETHNTWFSELNSRDTFSSFLSLTHELFLCFIFNIQYSLRNEFFWAWSTCYRVLSWTDDVQQILLFDTINVPVCHTLLTFQM